MRPCCALGLEPCGAAGLQVLVPDRLQTCQLNQQGSCARLPLQERACIVRQPGKINIQRPCVLCSITYSAGVTAAHHHPKLGRLGSCSQQNAHLHTQSLLAEKKERKATPHWSMGCAVEDGNQYHSCSSTTTLYPCCPSRVYTADTQGAQGHKSHTQVKGKTCTRNKRTRGAHSCMEQ